MNKTIRVMIVDDQRLIRQGLKLLLELEPDITVVAEAENGQDALDLFSRTNPDVVLMDVQMPILDGVKATRVLTERFTDINVIVLTTFNKDHYVIEAVQAGAKGFLLKDSSGEEIAAAVRAVRQGKAMIDPAAANALFVAVSHAPPASQPSQPMTEPLSGREIAVLRLVAGGMTNAQIAAELRLADGTVKNYVSAIIQKTASRDRTEAAVKARTLGLI